MENLNHLFCRKVLFFTGPHYRLYEVDLVVPMVSFISVY